MLQTLCADSHEVRKITKYLLLVVMGIAFYKHYKDLDSGCAVQDLGGFSLRYYLLAIVSSGCYLICDSLSWLAI